MAENNLEYAYAKACALSPSPRPPEFGGLQGRSLADCGELLFPGRVVPQGPGLLGWLHQTLTQEALDDCFKILASFPTPPPLLAAALQVHELRWVKQAWAAALRNLPPPVRPVWPGKGDATLRSPFLKVLAPTTETFFEASGTLDSLYFDGLRAAAEGLRADDALVRFLVWEEGAEASLTALRLRFGYGWDLGRARAVFSRRQAGLAQRVFSLPGDHREAWDSWTYAGLLNPRGTSKWTPDPRAFETNLAGAVLVRARGLFRSLPLTVEALYGFFRWKTAEAALWCRTIEAVALGMERVAP